MHKNVMNNNRLLFKTIQQYLETDRGAQAEFVIKRNRLFPMSVCHVDCNGHPPGEKNVHGESGPYYGWYSPLSVMFRTDDPRPCDLLKAHYQGIDSMKARLQVAYFASLKNRWVNRFLIPAHVSIRPKNGDMETIVDSLGDMVFGGLGSKVKIFKFDEAKLVNILKEGYQERFLLNEISVRQNFQDVLPIPRLLKSNRKTKVFEEEYKPAVPVRELNHQTWPLMLDLFESLFIYYERNTVTSKSTSEYLDKLLQQIKQKAHLLPSGTQDKVSELISITDKKWMKKGNDETLIVKGHGDFWLGNILIEEDGKRLLIVDWERTDNYSLMHDFFTFLAIYSLEQGNFKIIQDAFDTSSCRIPVKELLQKYQQHFTTRCDRPFLERQLVIFLLERLWFSLRLLSDTPFASREIEKEIARWHVFFKQVSREGLLTGLIR
jgi:hypothetical protein